MASPRQKVRIPSWIGVDTVVDSDEARQPSSSPPRRSPTKKKASPKFSPVSRWEERKSSRKSELLSFVPRESQLVFLCRQLDWTAALLHLEEHPEQAEPIQCMNGEECSSFSVSYANDTVYYETALNILCSFGRFESEAEQEDSSCTLLGKLLEICPKQTIISHMDAGHTALRSLLRNQTCNPKILSVLLRVMKLACSEEEFRRLCVMPDRECFRPIDHVIFAFHQGASCPLEILKVFVKHCGGEDVLFANPALADVAPSPLIRLLSMGNAASASRVSPKLSTPSAFDVHPSAQSSKLVYDAARFFLQRSPSLIDHTALTTKCTPFHVALRNYGNNPKLIECFLLEDSKNNHCISQAILRSLQQENNFGDLPIHVASSVGVPVPVLKLVLQATVEATSTTPSNKTFNLCWTVNHAGYSPIDLEWIRHMEDGKGLFMARSFYPLEAGGIKKTFWKQDEFYRVLLQQAVQQAMDVRGTTGSNTQPPSTHELPLLPSTATLSRRTPRTGQTPPQQAPIQHGLPQEPSEQPTWELLLHRIFLIAQTAATGRVPHSQTDLVDCLLHAACQLSFPVAPSMPLPLLELILYIYPTQLLTPQTFRPNDEREGAKHGLDRGNLPLHCAVQAPLHPAMGHRHFFSDEFAISNLETHEHICKEWESWVKQLLEHGPEASSAANGMGQLPLHKLLEYDSSRNPPPLISTHKKKSRSLSSPERARQNVLEALVEQFPSSVDVMDPATRLLPFQMAAASAYMPIEAVFYLLLRSPDAVLAGR